jgi:hypothetical protein
MENRVSVSSSMDSNDGQNSKENVATGKLDLDNHGYTSLRNALLVSRKDWSLPLSLIESGGKPLEYVDVSHFRTTSEKGRTNARAPQ